MLEDNSRSTEDVINEFNEVFNAHDVDGVMAMMTGDCVFESTRPQPDGERAEGQEAVRRCWQSLFDGAPNARFSTEEMFTNGDRCVVRWRYDWGDGHIRGVDVFKVRDGKVAEKLAYVKG
ncbi:MAG TPA: nuclear transport factor 2 family protein [Chloroflexota bacterium]|jgi:ketosteroid isomerase-like protein|nr:nuclear transport factor 2 family protein [Chloroflexota bacterium]